MASADHLPNLEMVLPAIVRMLDRHPPPLSFDCLAHPNPASARALWKPVCDPWSQSHITNSSFKSSASVNGTSEFASFPTDSDRTKSNNKWVEYTALGIAVVASAGLIYDESCSDGCGLLASDLDDWSSALESLVDNDAERLAMVERAQHKLETRYGIADHRRQILEMLDLAREFAKGKLIKEDA